MLNHSGEEAEFTVRLEVGSDFADLFEIKHAREKKGRTTRLGGRRRAAVDLPARGVPPGDA